ncbi:MAG TPA: hypothetical protein VKU40_08365 [Thermoanaerobaculia bacterium]|nr:hypothetical protein [Thermoanaerobaculia bacterium]
MLDKPHRGEDYLRLAWKMQPLERDDLLGDTSLFATPDPSVGPHLKQAFESFEEMGRQCSRGDGQRAKNALAQAERQLADAARRMQTYSLRP